MLRALMVNMGYACVPYRHDHDSAELKDIWIHSRNIESMYFVTATFSDEGKSYFSSHANHYILVKYGDEAKIRRDLKRFNQEKISFMLSSREDLFQREISDPVNFVSVYYLAYGEPSEDIREVAELLARRTQVGRAVWGSMDLYCTEPVKFTFPYSQNIIVLEVASEKSHQSVKKYCEKMRRDACQKGIKMSNLFALSLLERLK